MSRSERTTEETPQTRRARRESGRGERGRGRDAGHRFTLGALEPDQQICGAASLLLVATLILPWYDKSFVPTGGKDFIHEGVSGLRAFTWVEAAVLLVCLSVLALLYFRARGRAFHLPFGDGTVIAGAGVWAALLIVWRLFDTPDLDIAGVGAADVGLKWGIVIALAAAAGLAASGVRLRAARIAEPPLPYEDSGWVEPPRRRHRDRDGDRRSRRGAVAEQPSRRLPRVADDDPYERPTNPLGGPPAWEGDDVPEMRTPTTRRQPPPPDLPPPSGPPAEPRQDRLF